jgi:hypothetical protein
MHLTPSRSTIAAVVLTAALAMAAPAVARSHTAASGIDAATVDGFHAVGCAATRAHRAGKLVATCANGRLPSGVMATAPNAARLGGFVATSYLLGQFVESRNFTCGAAGFVPEASSQTYELDVSELFVNGPTDEQFMCNPVLPDHAVVRSMTAALADGDPSGNIECSLWRSPLSLPLGSNRMADVATTDAFDGGATFPTTNSISTSLIENASYEYLLDCELIASPGHLMGVFGVTLGYQVNETDG